jgi:hypothetical protein
LPIEDVMWLIELETSFFEVATLLLDSTASRFKCPLALRRRERSIE